MYKDNQLKIIKNKTVYLEHSLNQQQHSLLKPHTNHYEMVHYIIHFEAPLQILKLNKSLWYKPTRPRIKLDFPSGFTIWNIHHLLLKMEIKGRKGSIAFGSTRSPVLNTTQLLHSLTLSHTNNCGSTSLPCWHTPAVHQDCKPFKQLLSQCIQQISCCQPHGWHKHKRILDAKQQCSLKFPDKVNLVALNQKATTSIFLY